MKMTIVTGAVLALGGLGCSAGTQPERMPRETGTASQSLFSRITYQGDPSSQKAVQPFTAAYTERVMSFNRSMAASTAFHDCFFNTANAYYQYQSGDPNGSLPHASQVLSAWENLQKSDDALTFDIFDQPDAGASAPLGSPTDYETQLIQLSNGFRADNPDWANCWCGSGCEVPANWACWSTATHLNGSSRERYQPWNWTSGTFLHEYMHTRGYNHLGALHSPNDGRDDSINYIMTDCAYEVVQESDRQCDDGAGHGIMHNTACGATQLRFLSSWSGTRMTSQTSSSCECVSDPLHQITIETLAGESWTADSGGSSSASFLTNWSSGLGAWQTLYVRSYGPRGTWADGSPTEIKVFNGQYGTATFGANGTGLATANDYWRFQNLSFPGQPVATGASVTIRSNAGWWAKDTGTSIAATAVAPSGSLSGYRFVVEEPTRTLVYLKSNYNHRFLTNTADPGLITLRTDGDLSYGTQLRSAPATPDDNAIAAQADAAYWLIDWNGGTLNDGDSVSFQLFHRDAWSFLSTLHTAGQLRQSWSAWADEAFTVHDAAVPAGAAVRHGDSITLKSSIAHYMTATGLAASAPVDTSSTTENPQTMFALFFVYRYDYDRSAAW